MGSIEGFHRSRCWPGSTMFLSGPSRRETGRRKEEEARRYLDLLWSRLLLSTYLDFNHLPYHRQL